MPTDNGSVDNGAKEGGTLGIKRLKFPIRFKILVILLLVVTTVVSLITFTMANLLHTDKAAYIHDMTSLIAVHVAEEARSLLSGYEGRLNFFGRLMADSRLQRDQKAQLLEELFEDFDEFAAVTLYRSHGDPVTIYDASQLSEAGLTLRDLMQYRARHPLPFDEIKGGKTYLENSSIGPQMPMLTLAVRHRIEDEGWAVVAGFIRLDELMRLAGRSRVFDTFLVDAQGVLLAHTSLEKVGNRERADWIPRLRELQKVGSAGTALEFQVDGAVMVGGFSYVEFGGLLAGVQIPKAAAFLTARELLNNLIWVSLSLLILAAISSLFWSRRITRPIERLSSAARVVGKGQFDINVDPMTKDEIGVLAGSFNQMTSELKTREQALRDAQVALIQSEKMAAFGQIGAGIAHEVKNPLAGILGYAQLCLRKMEKENLLYRNLQIIEKETRRCKTIIDNLMRFARQEKVIREPMDINQTIEDAVAIVNHQLSIHNVKIIKDLAAALPTIHGNGNQIQQVLINLFINAQQAMEGNAGWVKVTTRGTDDGQVEIRIADNGPGIPKDIQAKILEPFFTTKAAGKGTGLGLSVSYGIIKEHKGEFRIESEAGQGAAFIILLPTSEVNDSAPAEVEGAQAAGDTGTGGPERSALTREGAEG